MYNQNARHLKKKNSQLKLCSRCKNVTHIKCKFHAANQFHYCSAI